MSEMELFITVIGFNVLGWGLIFAGLVIMKCIGTAKRKIGSKGGGR